LAIADGRVKRFEQLEGAVPQKEIEAARIERTRCKSAGHFVGASIDSAEPLWHRQTGVVSASHHLLAGQVVDAKEVLFEIVDPDRLAVEALAYDAGIAATLVSASALAEQTALELKFVGGGQQLREQALPLLFRITSTQLDVAVGQPVKVIVRTAHEIKGAAVPRAALTKVGAGETAVWVHAEAERFVARKVRHPVARCRQCRHQPTACTTATAWSRGRRPAGAGALNMFDFIIHTSLKQRLMVLGMSLLLVVYGALTPAADAGRCLPRPQQAHRDADDRSRRHGAGRSRAAGELSRSNRA
jgi:hypothetical protein